MIGSALFARLSAATGVTSEVSSRIYPNLVPQGKAVPAIWYSTEDVQPLRCRTPGGTFEGFFEVGVIGPNYDTVAGIIKAVRVALDGFDGVAGGFSLKIYPGIETPDGYNDELKFHEKSLRFKTIGQTVQT